MSRDIEGLIERAEMWPGAEQCDALSAGYVGELLAELVEAIKSLRAPVTGDVERAEAEFTAYFVRNYPGPDTIIHKPEWHAPRIWRAALAALRTASSAWSDDMGNAPTDTTQAPEDEIVERAKRSIVDALNRYYVATAPRQLRTPLPASANAIISSAVERPR